MFLRFRMFKVEGGRTLYQYGRSKPAHDEEEAFFNWFKDTFGVKE